MRYELTANQYAALNGGITKQAVAQRRKAGKVEYIEKDSRYYYIVDLPEGTELPPDEAAPSSTAAESDLETFDALKVQVEVLKARNEALGEQIATAREHIDLLTAELSEARQMLTRSQDMVQMALQRIPERLPADGTAVLPPAQRSGKVSRFFALLKSRVNPDKNAETQETAENCPTE